MSENERLLIKDLGEVNNYDQVEAVIREYHDADKFCVFIDGLYNIEINNNGGIREANIERANKIKMLVDSYRLPLICTAESKVIFAEILISAEPASLEAVSNICVQPVPVLFT